MSSSILRVVFVVLAVAPTVLRADVTIRYRIEMSSPVNPAADKASSSVIYMRGNQGVTVDDDETTIVDFGRQQVTVIDTAHGKYATVGISEYESKTAAQMAGVESKYVDAPGVADILKTMKTTCQTKDVATAEKIQGVSAVERDLTCITTTDGPNDMKMTMTTVTRIWSAAPGERLRVPGLWQLSGFELWENYVMYPAGSADKAAPEQSKAFRDAMKGQSALLRLVTEMSNKMTMPGIVAGAAGDDAPFMTMKKEISGISTELLDDALFSVPAGFSEMSFDALTKEMDDDEASAEKEADAKFAPPAQPAIPESVKAFIPTLFPLTETQPEAPLGPDGNKLQGRVQILVTVGPQGNVVEAEVLSGPEELKKVASDAVRQWTFRPVIRDGKATTAYTEVDVPFFDFPKGPPAAADFRYSPEMEAADDRIEQLRGAFPRTPEQELADIEQDSGGGDSSRRYARLGDMALRSVQTGANEKAKAYATELLESAKGDVKGWNYGNAIFKGHTVLGLLALRDDAGDVATADKELLEAGKTPGSPQLNSFGPNMTLADELLKKGEKDTVLEYFELCRKFWKPGAKQLDAWTAAVNDGKTPAFGANLLY